jgi:hypothetical protein
MLLSYEVVLPIRLKRFLVTCYKLCYKRVFKLSKLTCFNELMTRGLYVLELCYSIVLDTTYILN